MKKAFLIKNICIKWRGEGVNEEGYDEKTGKILIKIDPKFFRPAEIDILLGNSNYARTKLGWKPEHNFESLVKEMVETDCN